MSINFVSVEEEEALRALERQTVSVAVEWRVNNFRIVSARQSIEEQQVIAYIQTIEQQERAIQATAESLEIDSNELTSLVEEEQLFGIDVASFNETDDFIYDQSLQSLFGFSLFFVIYTIAYSIRTILDQKMNGIWDRLILSPASKAKMYIGHVIFSFLLGYIQIVLIFSLFYFGIGVNFHGGFATALLAVIPYLFVIVSLGVLLGGLVTNPRQLDGFIPFLAVSMAMLGGAYWPLEIVTAEWLVTLSHFVPLTYGMEMLKGATILNWDFTDFLLPTSILLAMGAVCMGVGLNLMERRKV